MSIVAWYVSTYDSAPIRKEFARETSAFYIALNTRGEERREKKESTWWRYFTDEQEARDFIAARDAAKEKRAQEDRAKRLLIAAAPDLLWALRNLSAIVDAAILSGDWKVDGACDPDMDIAAARAAIAKARGDA